MKTNHSANLSLLDGTFKSERFRVGYVVRLLSYSAYMIVLELAFMNYASKAGGFLAVCFSRLHAK